jgi:hypothetical protein
VSATAEIAASAAATGELVAAAHVVNGVIVEGDVLRYRSRDLGIEFTTPALDLGALAPPRAVAGPAFDVKLADIVDFLDAVGRRMDVEQNVHMRDCVDRLARTNVLPRRILEKLVGDARLYLTRANLMRIVEASFDPALLDGWVPQIDPFGNTSAVRAFPPRLVHVLAGNSPLAAAASIAQGALVKAVNLFKMPSNDPFTAVAILRTMADVDPGHPVLRSMSAVYWRGGDETVERTLYRPHYFDKIVAWGGGDAINNVIRYLGPGLQLVSFDPKTSISMIGPEGFADAVIDEVADRAAQDVGLFNQEACSASRFIFAEGPVEAIDRFCGKLADRLAVDRDYTSAVAAPPPIELRDEVEVLRMIAGPYDVWGRSDGSGLVIRSSEPVEFHPVGKTVNVVSVASLEEAVAHANVATQTVGVYPSGRGAALRDALASAGAQRVVALGAAGQYCSGSPHDAMYPLHRFVHWMVDEAA